MSNRLKKKDIVYISAYIGKGANEFFICKATILDLPSNYKPTFRVKITAVADRAVGASPSEHQAVLLGRTFSKQEEDMHSVLHQFLEPGGWIEIVTK